MSKILNLFFKDTFITRFFIITGALYMLLMIVTTIYSYARLDYVRTGQQAETGRANNLENK